jgi:hypothetical protein
LNDDSVTDHLDISLDQFLNIRAPGTHLVKVERDSMECVAFEIRHGLADIAARRQRALDRWSRHAEALHRVGLLDQDELREMIEYADAAYSYATEELAHQPELPATRAAKGV